MPGSRNGENLVNANFNKDGNLNVNWNLNPEIANSNKGWRFEVESCYKRRYFKLEYLLVLMISSTLQAFCQFLARILLTVNIFCYLSPVYL